MRAGEFRCCRRRGGGDRPYCGADPRVLAAHADHSARRFRLCARRPDGVVRGQWGRLHLWAGEERPPHRRIAAELAEAQEDIQQTGKPARRFQDFTWSTRKSWSRERRVIGEAEWTKKEANPRFIVISLTTGDGRHLYEEINCARGEIEGPHQGMSDRPVRRPHCNAPGGQSAPSVVCPDAYVLVEGMGRLALRATDLADHLRHHSPLI